MGNRRATVLGCGALILVVGLPTCYGFRILQDEARLASCRPELLFWDVQAYAKAHAGSFPPLSSRFGRLIFDADDQELAFAAIDNYVCDFDPKLPPRIQDDEAADTPINDWSYFYLGYFIGNEFEGKAFLRAYHERVGREKAFDTDLPTAPKTGSCGTDKLIRLCELQSLPPDSPCKKLNASTVPVIIEWPGHHRSGAKVVYLDGHTECVAFPGKFPMTKEFIEGLRVIDGEVHLAPWATRLAK